MNTTGTLITRLDGLQWTRDDLRRKFNGAFVLAYYKPSKRVPESERVLKGFGETPEVFSIDDAEGGGIVVGRTQTSGPIAVAIDSFYIVEDRPPACITNLGENSCFLFRYNPERQWRRGVSSHNGYFLALRNDGRFTQQAMISWGEATGCFNPRHVSLDEAMESFKRKECVGRALGNIYHLFRKSGEKIIHLYRRQTLLGSFMGSKFFAHEQAGKLLYSELLRELPILKERALV